MTHPQRRWCHRASGALQALAARHSDVLRLVLGLGLWLTIIGVLIGLVGAFVSTPLMASLLSEISGQTRSPFALRAALLVAVTVLAAYLPARCAASIDPIRALRAE
jgi:putative ABC transport system permease protein